MTKAYWIGHATVDDFDAYAKYREATPQLLPNTTAVFWFAAAHKSYAKVSNVPGQL